MFYTLNNYHINSKRFSFDLANMILEYNKPPIFLCVGSNKIVDDSLGALCGELLKNYYKIDAQVFGDLKCPMINNNLKNVLQKIKLDFNKHCVVVIDSSIGRLEHLYDISLNYKGLVINCLQNNKIVGDIGISSVTYLNGINELLLQKTEKKRCVFKVANFVASGIYNALKLCKQANLNQAI